MGKNGTVGKKIEEEEEEDQTVIMTVRCIDMASPTSGTTKVPCSECGEMTWLSASSRNIKFDKIICDRCFFKSGKHKDKDYHGCVTEECLNDALEALERRGIKTTKEEMIITMEDHIGKEVNIIHKKKIKK